MLLQIHIFHLCKKIRVGASQGFRPTYKRAIITLKEGDSINYNIANISNN
jgi:ribosomal protein L23